MTVAFIQNYDFPFWANILTVNAVLLNHAATELQKARNRAYEAIADLRLSSSTARTPR